MQRPSIRASRFLLLDRRQHLVRVQRQAADRRPGRVAHRVGDRRCRRDGRRLADADHAALRHVVQHDVDLRHVGHAGQQVHLHVRVHHLAGHAIEDAVLEQREVDRRDDAAVGLALRGQLVDDQPAVLDGEDARDPDDAGLDVNARLGKLHPAGPRARQAVFPLAVDRDRLGPDQLAGVLPGQALRRRSLDEDASALRHQVLRRRSERRRDLREQRVARQHRRHANGRHRRRGGRAAAGPAAERQGRVADLRLHTTYRQAERFGRDDRDNRPRAGADVLRAALDHHAAVRCDVHVGS